MSRRVGDARAPAGRGLAVARVVAAGVTVAQAVAAGVVVARLARGRRRLPRLRPVRGARGTISVVIPARDEAARITPCLRATLADPAVTEVIVVDDGSGDATAEIAAALGATVLTGEPLPAGWVGKQWALHQGVAAARGQVVVTLDADARPEPGLFGALAQELTEHDLVSAAPRFACDGALEQALHASMLATLVYRFGPVGPRNPPPPHRVIANGQCLAFRRAAMAEAGAFEAVRGKMTDDVALARFLAARGWRVGFLDAGALLEVDMHDSTAELWREWGRSLPLRDVTGARWQAADLAVIWLTAALPVLRLAAGRPTGLDAALLTVRLLLAGALRGSYTRPGAGLWWSPLLDPAAALRLTQATLRPVRTWRGRTYPPRPETSVPSSTATSAPSRPATTAPVSGGGRPGRPGRSAGR
ncbi:glycosyltransferase [Nonomuraea sp. NPDC002799]